MKVAIITARLGSKRLKRKNIKNFFGKPIIYYPIKACQKSKIFKKIYVTTESSLISKISKKFKASVPFIREKKFSDDKTGTLPVVKDAINKLKIKSNTIVCCVYPVTPLTSFETLILAYKIFKKSKCSFLFPVIKSKKKTKHSFKLNKRNMIKKKDLSKDYYIDAGQFYFGKAKNFMTKKSLHYSGSSKAMILSSNNALDVNTNNDWKKLKELYRRKLRNVEI